MVNTMDGKKRVHRIVAKLSPPISAQHKELPRVVIEDRGEHALEVIHELGLGFVSVRVHT